MSKKKSVKRSTPASLKREVDQLDKELATLLQQRADLIKAATQLEAEGTAVDCLVDDDQRIEQLAEKSRGSLPPDELRTIFREIFSGCRTVAARLKVAFLGPEYSYSHQAAIERFGQSAELVPVATIPAVFEEVSRGTCQFGLVPVENSSDGRVTDTLDMFARQPLKICGEVQLRIHHCLLSKCDRSAIREVYSKPQALSQCRNWLAKHLPQARVCEITSTAAAAQLATQQEGVAAIASRAAGVNYGLNFAAENIEDNPRNVTRFAVIGNESGKKTGDDKTAMMFQTEHKPGALADAMNIFKRNRLNLTWIESFPVSGGDQEYLFFVEMEGHESEMKIRRAIASLEKKTIRFEVLGSFRKMTPTD
ncbi:prephenate dehydratase [Blastopirellula retiformator]|uniref:Bifunctional chorismate mutase/prephenate dehydratase n=1 Tax=Blastopirellula retiformator TaxID=2527970 RepID=A0A5C5UWJ2_9BACT|nr:prephenate dehydratase [Blastopirellula retiformator]TWT29927.1 P-protein [Blastopirellula retiformator]